MAVMAVSALLINTACYSYLPAIGGALVPGRDVRVELTSEGSVAMQAAVGPRIRLIEGRVQEMAAGGSATMVVEQLTSLDGVTVPYAGRTAIAIPAAVIRRVDVRTLDRKRSWMAGGVMGGVFLAAVATALAKARSRPTGDVSRPGGSPPDLRVP
ncbi:MAG: hypothetical protein P3A28_00030 [Gemmatimonadota bacterium]|nr:hypothetical protein [Gemmatimonadota bacterium]